MRMFSLLCTKTAVTQPVDYNVTLSPIGWHIHKMIPVKFHSSLSGANELNLTKPHWFIIFSSVVHSFWHHVQSSTVMHTIMLYAKFPNNGTNGTVMNGHDFLMFEFQTLITVKGLGNGLRFFHQSNTWTDAYLSIGLSGTNFTELFIAI